MGLVVGFGVGKEGVGGERGVWQDGLLWLLRLFLARGWRWMGRGVGGGSGRWRGGGVR